jgi:hypothetical protein
MAEQQRQLPQPVDWDQLYPGRFLKASDLMGKKPVLEISQVNIEELIGDNGKQIKGLIAFRGKDKQWALNKTNGICLKAMFGREVQKWVGKRVSLFSMMVRNTFTGEDEPAIRVWGSPDLPADKAVEIRLPRKKAFTMTMHRVVLGGQQPANNSTPSQ